MQKTRKRRSSKKKFRIICLLYNLDFKVLSNVSQSTVLNHLRILLRFLHTHTSFNCLWFQEFQFWLLLALWIQRWARK